MIDYDRIQQAILQSNLRSSPKVLSAGVFTCFLNPDDPAHYANYAIPNQILSGDLTQEIQHLVHVYQTHHRQPRLEYLAPCAPGLEEQLHNHGFSTESKTALMVCSRETIKPPPPVAGLVCVRLTQDSALEQYQQFVYIQNRSFGDDHAPPPSLEAASNYRDRFGEMLKVLVYLNGEPAGVGTVTYPEQNTAEAAGIATLGAYRRRGIAAAVTYALMEYALADGLETAFLTAVDIPAGRVYERAGFVQTGQHQVNISMSELPALCLMGDDL